MVDEDKYDVALMMMEYMNIYDNLELSVALVMKYYEQIGYPIDVQEINDLIEIGVI